MLSRFRQQRQQQGRQQSNVSELRVPACDDEAKIKLGQNRETSRN